LGTARRRHRCHMGCLVRDLLAFLGPAGSRPANRNIGRATRRNDAGSKRMSTNDDVHRSATTGVTPSEHAPLWAIGLSALLIALGFARRRSGDANPATGDRRSLEVGRGRSAETPSQIPARGWKDILLRVYHGISGNRILLVAAGVTFYSLLAIFPGIAALISIYGLFADPATVASHLDTIASVAPGGAVDVL